jgi:hypothetical protein
MIGMPEYIPREQPQLPEQELPHPSLDHTEVDLSISREFFAVSQQESLVEAGAGESPVNAIIPTDPPRKSGYFARLFEDASPKPLPQAEEDLHDLARGLHDQAE